MVGRVVRIVGVVARRVVGLWNVLVALLDAVADGAFAAEMAGASGMNGMSGTSGMGEMLALDMPHLPIQPAAQAARAAGFGAPGADTVPLSTPRVPIAPPPFLPSASATSATPVSGSLASYFCPVADVDGVYGVLFATSGGPDAPARRVTWLIRMYAAPLSGVSLN